MTLVVNINKQNIKLIRKKGPIRLAFFCFLFFTISALMCACEETAAPLEIVLTGRTMGTTYNVKALPNQRTIISSSALQIQIDKELEDINQVMSTYIEDSEISVLNQSEIGVKKNSVTMVV